MPVLHIKVKLFVAGALTAWTVPNTIVKGAVYKTKTKATNFCINLHLPGVVCFLLFLLLFYLKKKKHTTNNHRRHLIKALYFKLKLAPQLICG